MTTPRTDLAELAEDYRAAAGRTARRIIVCAGTGCVANGSLALHASLARELAAAGLPVVLDLNRHADNPANGLHVSRSGCQGFCQMGPLVTILPDNILYCRAQAADAAEIVRETIQNGRLVERLLFRDPSTGQRHKGTGEIPFYKRQTRRVLEQCGRIDPEDIREYVALGGYSAAARAYTQMAAEAVCSLITESGLRGRGGGGFPTGRKWELTRRQPGADKYIICNGDEGDPGAFMDRSVMEGDPHRVLEGMLIAARAVGANRGLVYVRAEYPLAVERMRKAIVAARAAGVLGPDVFGSGLAFDCDVMEGAGAFVCGEETAMIASIGGGRGMPMPKPPFPAESGLDGKPTVINNVETLATVPLIVRDGVAAFRALGVAGSPGTKTFALTGHVANTGLIEVPFGSTLRQIIFEIGGGVTDAAGRLNSDDFKAVQIGGPSGGCLTAEHLDLPLDFDSLKTVGAMIGSGGLVVMNRETCMVNIAQFFMNFTQNESCGKCAPCREGTRQMLALLKDITGGQGTEQTLALLESLGGAVQRASLCGLGKTAPSPVLSTLRLFRAEYEAHVRDGRCPAGQCRALAAPAIDPALCKGCTACVKKCPAGAITGTARQPHALDADKCLKCGACKAACRFNAITGV